MSLYLLGVCVCLSLLSHPPRQERMPVIEPFSPPDLTPECPVRTPSLSRYTHFLCYRCCGLFFFFHYYFIFTSTFIVGAHSDSSNNTNQLLVFSPLPPPHSRRVFQIKATFDVSVSEVSSAKVRCRSRTSVSSPCWAGDTLARYPVEFWCHLLLLVLSIPHTLDENTSARRCCCRSIERRGRCTPSKP